MRPRLPDWFKQPTSDPELVNPVEGLLDELGLHTICESAHCPNIGRCFARQTATFLILGNVCTRNCRYCAVEKGRPLPVVREEPANLLQAVEKLNLKYVVITSVTRDDLPDGGASHFVETVNLIHRHRPDTLVEVLIPDFDGNPDALRALVTARPEVINHNVETVPRLFPQVRALADYERSLELLARVKDIDPAAITKSGLMVGLGETDEEIIGAMRDLRDVRCDLVTIGQYLAPSDKHQPIDRYLTPEEFERFAEIGREMGLAGVASAPLVRSSYKAAELYAAARKGVGG